MYKTIKKLFFGKKRSLDNCAKTKSSILKVSKEEFNAETQNDSTLEDNDCKFRTSVSPTKTMVVKTKAEIHSFTDNVPVSRSSYADMIRQSIENVSKNSKDSHSASQVIQGTNSNEGELYMMENTDSTDINTDSYHTILEEVAEFYQNFPDLQTDVRILVSKNVIVYVLGTNHANSQCKNDVINIIDKIRPKTVLVELCALRACSCKKHKGNAFQSTPKFTFNYLRTTITQLGFLPAMIFFTDVFREHLVSESSLLHYGGEFIAAMATAQAMDDCKIILADRPIEITVKRQASAMGNWRGIRVTSQVTLALLLKKQMKQLILSANRLVFDDPKTYEVLVFERDLFLTYSIQQAAKEYENEDGVARIIAVIGQGHINGIQTYWGKVPSNFIPFIMSPHTVLDL